MDRTLIDAAKKGRTGLNRLPVFLLAVLAAVFMGSNLIIFNPDLALIIQEVSLILSAGVFILIFFLKFFRVEESVFK